MTIAQLDQTLRRKEIAPVYLLLGSEWHLHRTATEHIAHLLHQLSNGSCTPTRFAADATSAGTIVEQAMSFGLFSAQQLLMVSHLEAWRADDLDTLAQYVTAPNPTTTLVLSAEKLDGRTKAAKAILQHAVVVTCKPLYANQIPDWIRMECDRRGKPIAREAAQLLADAVGTELSMVADAIDKLMLFVGDARLIDPQAVEHVVLETSSQDIFAFTRAVGEQDVGAAIARLQMLLTANEPAVRILTLLARHWRLLYQMRWRRDQDRGTADERALAAAIKVHPFFVREYIQQSKRHSLDSLQQGFAALMDTDRLLKRSSRQVADVMAHCLFALCVVHSSA